MAFLGILGKKETEQAAVKSDKPKVLIGVAGFQGVVAKAQENFFAFAYHCGRRCPDYDFFLKILIKREQFRARNNIVELALVNDCQYLLMLDDDMIVPPDLFEQLMAHKKPVTGALYYQRGGSFHPVIMRTAKGVDGNMRADFVHAFDSIITKPGLYEVDIIGGGCMLFDTEVFRKIPQPYFWIDGIVGTDVHICNQLKAAGVPVYVDTNIELGHVGEEEIITSRSVPKHSQKLGLANEELWNDLREFYAMGETELEAALIRSNHSSARLALWNEKPRETWEGVRDFYRSGGPMQVHSLASFNLKYDQARDWVINDLDRTAKPGSHLVDYGAGIGYCTVPMARAGYQITAMDLSGTPTLEFLRWRLKKHGLTESVQVVEFADPVPPPMTEPVDGVIMISVFEHLWDAYGVLDWLGQNVKPRGFLLCDTLRNMQRENEPQHIIRYDPHRILHDVRRLGWRQTPENPFLYMKER